METGTAVRKDSGEMLVACPRMAAVGIKTSGLLADVSCRWNGQNLVVY